ncbi:cobalamin biosynthesis protein [Shewanella intestini]|uniref:Cobalamin biosynthesis protein CbiB n=1 Tax=Shewanella intestini TaxID=2017544 RepID=A0ABS5HXZ4_9GAMM|nr:MULTISPECIES: cobalamin biosynthesis protein [Shewanella]MBR9726626.1 cobalamin biosynthesis protein CbiB [Shewanella intestini]MRG34808.1 cobalamin biosynthesis protein CbiB [Shewanella sp. XMDDZSB0408]
MNNLATLIAQDGSLLQDCVILFFALICARYAPLAAQYQPLKLVQRIADLLAGKVNRSNRPNNQRQIAGILATLILIIPIVLVCHLFISIAAFPWFFKFIVLYLCLPELSFSQTARIIQRYLHQGNKTKAREKLAIHANYRTDALSEVGISKATIELQLTSPLYGFMSVILFFLIGGLPLVVAAKLLRQLELSWPSYHPQFTTFGALVFSLNRLLFFIPKCLWLITLALPLGRSPFKALKIELQSQQPNNDVACHSLGAQLLNIELGGPQQFIHQDNITRVARNKLAGTHLPNSSAILLAEKLISPAFYFWLILTMLLPLIWFALKWLQHM